MAPFFPIAWLAAVFLRILAGFRGLCGTCSLQVTNKLTVPPAQNDCHKRTNRLPGLAIERISISAHTCLASRIALGLVLRVLLLLLFLLSGFVSASSLATPSPQSRCTGANYTLPGWLLSLAAFDSHIQPQVISFSAHTCLPTTGIGTILAPVHCQSKHCFELVISLSSSKKIGVSHCLSNLPFLHVPSVAIQSGCHPFKAYLPPAHSFRRLKATQNSFFSAAHFPRPPLVSVPHTVCPDISSPLSNLQFHFSMATPACPWASAAALTTLSRRSDNPFLTGKHAANSIATFTAACTSGKLGNALVPNLSTKAAEQGGVMQGDHMLAIKPGQRIRAIRLHHLESPVLSADDTSDPPYPIRYCAVEVAGVHSNPKLAVQPGARTAITVLGADGSEELITTKPSQPMIIFAPLACAVALVDGPLQLQEFCQQHAARPALPVSQPKGFGRQSHIYDTALADMHVVWLFNPPPMHDVEETCRALELLGTVKAMNIMAADSGKPYMELYFKSADTAHKGLARS